MAALQEEGRAVFKENCASCHGPGIGNPGLAHKPGTAALQAKYAGAVPALLEQRTDMAPEMIAYFVRNGISVMPMFRKTEVSDAQLRALEAYLTRNSKPPRR
ncbi:MAG: p-cresol methylhydroxylase [Sphingomonas sp.]|nr:MAG: p-cresol methylhydroxylase [Sphingomonas sp.]